MYRKLCTQNKHNKNDSGNKTSVKKASDHSDVDMFALPLQFGTLVKGIVHPI